MSGKIMNGEGAKRLPLWPIEEKRLEIVPENMWPFNAEEYGKRLRERRLSMGYSKKQLAAAVGCTVQNIHKIEKGIKIKTANGEIAVWNKTIKRKYVPAFAEILDCSCSYLLGYTNEPNGIWDDPEKALHFPVVSYRQDQILSVACVIRAYDRDPELFLACIEMMKDSYPKRRGIYLKRVREVLNECNRQAIW